MNGEQNQSSQDRSTENEGEKTPPQKLILKLLELKSPSCYFFLRNWETVLNLNQSVQQMQSLYK